MENPVIILGANPLGRQAKEILETNGNVVYCFLDDNKKLHQTEIDNITVMGSTDDDGYLKLIGKKTDSFVAVDDNKLRKNLVTMLQEVRHVQPVNVIAHTAIVPKAADLGHGNFIDYGVIFGAGSSLGNHCIVNAGAIIGMETTIGDFVQVGSGTVINAGTVIENEVFIGSGVTIVGGITIGKGARIGAGSVVVTPVKAGDTVFGNPAQTIKT
ncbi:NeuD/PglB/VioB family sugar acetyltransferase [Chryseolinea lacunae]|uniref:NeuD/PglB/VioB family sugar acetyltransferase n=1 Tax=Chryseolinea lacunae TaxID=2801331 RepID=A0ABS1KNI1_9BACT|nr:NeuD/PglB/VioB family sugar acetyltransferase [Chryseolinea lacunae]MBL0740899.1 NeuD/PglB/VioB family sugar acetyltransferase [Chryseolinea lacunae]